MSPQLRRKFPWEPGFDEQSAPPPMPGAERLPPPPPPDPLAMDEQQAPPKWQPPPQAIQPQMEEAPQLMASNAMPPSPIIQPQGPPPRPQMQQEAPPPRTPFGAGPLSQAHQQAALQYADKAGQKVSPMRAIAGGFLGALRPTRHLAEGVMRPGMAQAEGRMKALKPAADEERLQQQAQSNEDIRLDNAATNKTFREVQAANQRAAAEDRRLKLLTSPDIEEERPGEIYRGNMDIDGKRYGVLPPETVAGRKAVAQKKAEQENWLEVPKPLREEFGLGEKAPRETIDSALRTLEAKGRAQEAATVRKDLADQSNTLRRELAGQSDATRRDLAGQASADRREDARIRRDEKPPTAAQSTVATYAARLKNSNKILDSLADFGGTEQFLSQRIPDWAGFLRTEKGRAFDQAQRDFINATLRRESGAVISDDEFKNARQQYLPQPGDSPADKERKRNARLINQQSFRNAAGKAYEDPDELLRSAGVDVGGGGAPKSPAAPPGGSVTVNGVTFPNQAAADAALKAWNARKK